VAAEDYNIRGANNRELSQVADLLGLVNQEIGLNFDKKDRRAVLDTPKTPEIEWIIAGLDQTVTAAVRTEMIGKKKRKAPAPAEEMIVSSLVVHPDYRRQGLGTALLQRSVEFADERLLPTVRLDLPFEHIAIKSLVAKAGFGTEPPYIMEFPEHGQAATFVPTVAEVDKSDGRIPTPMEKKMSFLESAYPYEEFAEEEISAIFEFMPDIVEIYIAEFNPRTRKKLGRYTYALNMYTENSRPVKEILGTTGFSSTNSFIVWKNGFAKSLAAAISVEDLRIMALSLAMQKQDQETVSN
jgi:GNAT superfamily N-acetyltransferase